MSMRKPDAPLILVVDDTDASRYVKQKILRDAGMNVVEASTGMEALQSVENLNPVLVLLDIRLPDIDGLEVCRRIRADPARGRVAILHISSTYVTGSIEQDSQQAGADVFLAEPVDPKELISVVRTLLRLRDVEIGLAQSEERLRLATDAAGLGTWDIDLHTGAATYDEQMRRLLGLDDAGGAVPRTWAAWQDRIHPADRQAVLDQFEASVKTGARFTAEHRVLSAIGASRWVAPGGKVHLENGRPVRMVGVLTDINGRKRIEVEREQVNQVGKLALIEAENLAKLKDEFLATLSHELRTPMGVVMTWLHMLRGSTIGPEDAANGLEVIERNSKQMLGLINDLLDVSRIVSGKLVLQSEPGFVEQLLELAIDNIRPLAASKGIRVEVDISAVTGPISMDSVRMQQAFANLLSNALKFTAAGGWIAVRCRQLGDKAEISISDSGEGISAPMLETIFDRFRQVDGSITRKHGGLGLGLAIVRYIVELHGGTVRAESAGLGKGSTFTVLLPYSPVRSSAYAHVAEVNGERLPGKRLSDLRILAVDDDTDSCEVLALLLRLEGAVVETANDSTGAMAAVGSWKPDIALLDVGMSGESGYDLLQHLRSRLGSDLPAIALTGYARTEDTARAAEAGFDAHLAKPFEPEALYQRIANLLGNPSGG